ncbi:hypothetical protein Dimus_025455 [Dionaea muscipula]
MAVGNVLGYAAGSFANLYRLLPFTKTSACDVYCANLKTCFLLDIVLLVSLTAIPLVSVPEPTGCSSSAVNNYHRPDDDGQFQLGQVKSAFKNLGKPMWVLFLVTALNWVAWFPFLLFDTDWVGKEVFGGDVNGSAEAERLYNMGVRTGSLGLMLTAGSLGAMSLAVDPLSRVLGGGRKLWGGVNLLLAKALAATVLVTKMAHKARNRLPPFAPPPAPVKLATLSLFAVMGIPQAVTFSIPFALASIFCSDSGAGQDVGVVD